MDEKTKKQLALMVLVLGPILIIIWGKNLANMIVSRQQERIKDQYVKDYSENMLMGVPDADMSGDKRMYLARVQEYEARQWGNNPFWRQVITEEKIDLSLEGVVWDDENPYAIINGEVRSVGDRVGVFEIAEIMKDKIILRRGEERRELNLFVQDDQ